MHGHAKVSQYEILTSLVINKSARILRNGKIGLYKDDTFYALCSNVISGRKDKIHSHNKRLRQITDILNVG